MYCVSKVPSIFNRPARPISRELHLNHNLLRLLPYELGKLFNLQVLGLKVRKEGEGLIGGRKEMYVCSWDVAGHVSDLVEDDSDIYREDRNGRKIHLGFDKSKREIPIGFG